MLTDIKWHTFKARQGQDFRLKGSTGNRKVLEGDPWSFYKLDNQRRTQEPGVTFIHPSILCLSVICVRRKVKEIWNIHMWIVLGSHWGLEIAMKQSETYCLTANGEVILQVTCELVPVREPGGSTYVVQTENCWLDRSYHIQRPPHREIVNSVLWRQGLSHRISVINLPHRRHGAVWQIKWPFLEL